MPAVLGMRGFGARNTDADRLTILVGPATYDTSNVPASGPSAVSIGGSSLAFRAPWYDDPNATQFEPSTSECWYHFQYYTGLNSSTANDGLVIGLGSNGSEFVAVSAEDSTNKLTLRVGGVVRATAVSEAFSVGNWKRVHVHCEGWATGDEINVYANGNLATPVLTYTLILADETALGSIGVAEPNEFRVVLKSGDGNGRIDNLIAWDPQDADFQGIQFFGECGIKEQVFTGDGAETDWSGSYTDIDEVPYSDTDKITAAAPGDESSFTTPAIGEPNVFAVRMLARVTRTGTDAGSNIGLKANDGANDAGATMAAPADGHVEHIFQQAADGLDWSPTKRDATRFAFVATA